MIELHYARTYLTVCILHVPLLDDRKTRPMGKVAGSRLNRLPTYENPWTRTRGQGPFGQRCSRSPEEDLFRTAPRMIAFANSEDGIKHDDVPLAHYCGNDRWCDTWRFDRCGRGDGGPAACRPSSNPRADNTIRECGHRHRGLRSRARVQKKQSTDRRSWDSPSPVILVRRAYALPVIRPYSVRIDRTRLRALAKTYEGNARYVDRPSAFLDNVLCLRASVRAVRQVGATIWRLQPDRDHFVTLLHGFVCDWDS